MNFRKSWIGIIGLMVAGCASSPSKNKTENKVYSRTDRARMLIEVANGALAEGDPTGALQSLALAEQEDRQLPELYHSMALAYHAKKYTQKALESAAKAIQIQPNYSDANNTFGKLLIDQEKYDEAIGPLRRAAEDTLYRDSYKAWTNLGILRYRQKAYRGAIENFQRAVQESPQQACIAFYYLGNIYLLQKREREAIEAYTSATRGFCASFAEARLALGQTFEKTKQYDQARKIFLEIQKLHPHTQSADRALKHLGQMP